MPAPERSFDWPGLMRAGINGRGLCPTEFWALTPAELMLMLGRGSAAPLSRAGLAALAKEWPDEQEIGDGKSADRGA